MNDQEKRELLIKAAVKFEGKWPKFEDSDKEEWGEGEKGLAVCILDFDDVEKSSVGDIGQVVISDCCKTVWQPFCNQREFEAFMQELADKAPEGAEYYAPTHRSPNFDEGWYKKDSTVWFFCRSPSFKWNSGCTQDPIKKRNLIPLPKREPAQWVPEVGREFEWMLDGVSEKWHYGYFVGLDKNGDMVIQRKDKLLDVLSTTNDNHNYKLRPISTESEEERDRLIDDGSKLIEMAHGSAGSAYKRYVKTLVDAGWRPNE